MSALIIPMAGSGLSQTGPPPNSEFITQSQRFKGRVSNPNGIVVGDEGDQYINLDTGDEWNKLTGNGDKVGWVLDSEAFGLVGGDNTGTEDSTDAFSSAIAAVPSGATLNLGNGTYLIRPGLDLIRSDIRIYGNATLKAASASTSPLLKITGSNIEFEGITIDGNQKVKALLQIGNGSTDWHFINVKHKRTQVNANTGTLASTADMVLFGARCMRLKWTSCKFKDASCSLGQMTGSIRAIRGGGPGGTDETQRFDFISVIDCDFDDIGPDQPGADAIVLQNQPADSNGEQLCTFLLDDNRFAGCGRRCIKLEIGGGLVCDNQIKITRAGPNPDWLFSAISVYGAETIVMGNNIRGGSMFYGIEVTWLPTFGRPRAVVVTGNTITSNATGLAESFGIMMKGCVDCSVIGNIVKNFRIGLAYIGKNEFQNCIGNIFDVPAVYGVVVQQEADSQYAYVGVPANIFISGTVANNATQYGVFLAHGTDITVVGTIGTAGTLLVSRAGGVTGDSRVNKGSTEIVLASSSSASYYGKISAFALNTGSLVFEGPFGFQFLVVDAGTNKLTFGGNSSEISLLGLVTRSRSRRIVLPITYTATIDLNFNTLNDQTTLALTGDVTFTNSNVASGFEKEIAITADASLRNLTFPAWTWLGTAPTTIAAGKTGVLKLSTKGTAAASVIAKWEVQA